MAHMSGFTWARLGVKWSTVESLTEPGVYNFPAELDLAAQQLISAGKRVIINFAGCHPSYRSHELACGYPDLPGGVDAFARVCAQIAARYPGLYGIEIGNEPDSYVGLYDWFGCLADPLDDWAGGARYARLIESSYRAVKAVNPAVHIIGGALMGASQDTPLARFMPGTLRENPPLDGWSYHAYFSRYPGDPALGITALDNYNYQMRATLDTFGYSKTPLYLTETAYSCVESNPDYPAIGKDKNHRYFSLHGESARLLRTWANKNRVPVFWYSFFENWRYVSLLYPDLTPTPALAELVK